LGRLAPALSPQRNKVALLFGDTVKKSKKVLAWAVKNHIGGILCDSARMPIFWNRKVAADRAAEYWGDGSKIARVEIRILTKP
jgi:hypothetical protein